MAGISRIHYAAPLSMISALLVGFFFALGHHLFYTHLAGTIAPTGTFELAGANISRQQLNTAVGTAFGFLVKSCLTITTAVAFVQAFWRSAKTARNGPTLDSLDNTYSLLSDFRGLFKARVWTSFPVPVLLAFIACLDFIAPIAEGPDGFCFNGPSQPVQRVAAAVAAQGQILSIPAPRSNISWSLDFWAPSLQCHDVDATQRDSVLNNILDHWGNTNNCTHAPGYLAWTGAADMTTPFVQTGPAKNVDVFQSATLTYGTAAAIYFATIPQFFNFAFVPTTAETDEKCNFFGSSSFMYSYPIADDLCLPGIEPPTCYGQQAWFTDSSLVRCDVVNASYSAMFNYTGETQTVNVITDERNDSSPLILHECFSGPEETDFNTAELRCNGTAGNCALNTAASRLLSYQGITAAFNDLLLGTITMGGYGLPTTQVAQLISKTPGMVINSSIATTILMDTEQLAFLTDPNGVNQTYNYLQQEISASNATVYNGISNKISTGQRGDLKSALQTLFTNITISLLSEEYLQANYSSPYAPSPMTQVTYNTYHNVYSYSATTLWVAYGLAILLTMLSLVLGTFSLVLNNGSFKNDFSTILRATRTVPMSEEILDCETDGLQPVPRHLITAHIMLGFTENDGAYDAAPRVDSEMKTPGAGTSLLSTNSGESPQIKHD